MKKILTIVAAALLLSAGNANAQENVTIGKQHITVAEGRMTPEALWAMGRISSYSASPDAKHIVYQVGYYSVKHNKSHHVLYMMNADGTSKTLLTKGDKNETDAAWMDNETIAFLTGGEVWAMKADGSERRQLSKTDGKVEGFLFSPDKKHVILLKSIPFHEIIKENPQKRASTFWKACPTNVLWSRLEALSNWPGAMIRRRLPTPAVWRRDWHTASRPTRTFGSTTSMTVRMDMSRRT